MSPEQQIASVTAIALTPGFISFALAPLLDWRFTRRAYAIVLAVIGALFTFAALLAVPNVSLVTAMLFFVDHGDRSLRRGGGRLVRQRDPDRG